MDTPNLANVQSPSKRKRRSTAAGPVRDLAALRAKQLKRQREQQSGKRTPLSSASASIQKGPDLPSIPETSSQPPASKLNLPFATKQSSSEAIKGKTVKKNPFETLAKSCSLTTTRPFTRSLSCSDIGRDGDIVWQGSSDDEEDDQIDFEDRYKRPDEQENEPILNSSPKIKEENELKAVKRPSSPMMELREEEKEEDEAHELTQFQEQTVISVLLKKSKVEHVSQVCSALKSTLEISSTEKRVQMYQDEADESTAIEDIELHFTKRSADAPLDWTLRKEFTVFSPNSFDWCSLATSSLNECRSISRFVSSTDNSLETMAKQEFDEALYYWVHPSSLNAPSHSSLIAKTSNKAETKPQALRDFEIADWDYFREREEEWEGKIVATLSHSTPGLRKALVHDGIEFHCAFSRKDSNKDIKRNFLYQDMDDETRRDLEEVDNKTGNGLTGPQDLDAISDKKRLEPLEFFGPCQVHGLYDFLLKWKEPRTDRRALSFPLLYSSKPFLNATLNSAKIVRSSAVKQASGDGHKLIVKGTILPHSFQRLLELFKRENGTFTCSSLIYEQSLGVGQAIHLGGFLKTLEYRKGFYYGRE